MATVDEYSAVHGDAEPAWPEDVTGELGDGGCNVVCNKKGVIVGRWSSWEAASLVLDGLQRLGSLFEYRLAESHRWVTATEDITTCSLCNLKRETSATHAAQLSRRGPGR